MTLARNFRRRSRAAQPRPLHAGLGQIRRSTQAPPRRADQHTAHPNAPSPANGTTTYRGAALRKARTPPTKGLRLPPTQTRQGCPQFSPGRHASQAPCTYWGTTAPPGRTVTRKPAIADRNLAHRHAHAPTTPASVKPRAAPGKTCTAKQSLSLPRPRPCEARPRATADKPNTCSLGPASLASLFNVPWSSLRPLLNSPDFGLLRPCPRDGGRISSHHFTAARGLGRTAGPFLFAPLGLTSAYPALFRHKNALWTERNRLLPPTAGLYSPAGVIKRVWSVKSRIYAA